MISTLISRLVASADVLAQSRTRTSLSDFDWTVYGNENGSESLTDGGEASHLDCHLCFWSWSIFVLSSSLVWNEPILNDVVPGGVYVGLRRSFVTRTSLRSKFGGV